MTWLPYAQVGSVGMSTVDAQVGTDVITIRDAVSQVYVIHATGLVMLSRKYSEGCVSSDSQLIGGFLAALLTFARNSYNKSSVTCDWEHDGVHRLRDIGMSCSRWFVYSMDEYTVAVLIPNQSPLIQLARYDIIDQITERIINTFLIFKMFDVDVGTEEFVKDYSADFGLTLDNTVYEVLSEFLGMHVVFEESSQQEIESKLT